MKITYDTIPETIAKILQKVKLIESILENQMKNTGHDKRKVSTDKGDALTIEQASEILGISKGTLYSWVRHNAIPSYKKGHSLYFSRTNLAKWDKRSKENTLPKPVEPVPVEDPDRITAREAVKLLKLPPSRIHYTIRSKNIPVISKEGNRLYFSKKVLMDAFAQGK
jgi:excisionase family DNA binding protein